MKRARNCPPSFFHSTTESILEQWITVRSDANVLIMSVILLFSLPSQGLDYQGEGFSSTNAQTTTSPPNSRARRNYDEQTCLPITVCMALKARDMEGFAVLEDERKIHHVKIVAAIRGFQEHSSNLTFEVEDGTGLLNVKQWLDETAECSRKTELRKQVTHDGIIVKVVGQLKLFDGQPLLLADSVRRLSSGNELAHHFLDVVYTAEKQKRSSQIVQPTSLGTTIQSLASGNGGDQIHDAVQAHFKGNQTDAGSSVQEVVLALQGRYNEAQVRAAIDYLSQDGTIYSTINEDYYKFAV